jgi:hypothetical protein
MVELMLEVCSVEQFGTHRNLNKIEYGTGFHSNGLWAESDKHPQDYRKISKDLGRVASDIAFVKSKILGVKFLHEFCSQHLKSCPSWIPKAKWENYSESTRILLERVEYTTGHIESLLIFCGLEMRLQVQQNVVSIDNMAVILDSIDRAYQIFNLIAQEDNRTNIQLSSEMRRIAVKTKRDGSVMKTIAFLGTVFLPATFVSVQCSEPIMITIT